MSEAVWLKLQASRGPFSIMAVTREKSAEGFGVEAYESVLLRAHKLAGRPLDSHLGSLRRTAWSVTPDDITRAGGVLEGLIDHGLVNGVVSQQKFLQGMRQALAKNSDLLTSKGDSAELAMLHIRTHITLVFGLMRRWLREDKAEPCAGRRQFPKTGTLRRLCTSSHMVFIQQLLSNMRVEDSSKPPAPEPTPVHMPIKDLVADTNADVDDTGGLPTCFANYLANRVRLESASAFPPETEYFPSREASRAVSVEPSYRQPSSWDPIIGSDGFPVLDADCDVPAADDVLTVRAEDASEAVVQAPQLRDASQAVVSGIETHADSVPVVEMKFRKQRVLAARCGGVTPRPKAKAASKKANAARDVTPRPKNNCSKQSAASAVKRAKHHSSFDLHSAVLSGPTNEAVPRCELCAKDADNKKRHVFTITRTSGSNFVGVARTVKDAIDARAESKSKMTKDEALKLRDSLLA